MTHQQLTEQQAVAFGQSEIWKEWTNDQIVRFQLFQNRLCIPFDRIHEAVEKVLDRPVYTHEFASLEHLRSEYLGDKPAPNFDEIIALIPADKLIILTTPAQ